MLGWHFYLLTKDALEGSLYRPVEGGTSLEEDMIADLAVFDNLGEVVFHHGIRQPCYQVFLGCAPLFTEVQLRLHENGTAFAEVQWFF